MSVQIKPLKGFKNHINNETNTLSLLVKSDYELREHLNESKQKLLISLTSIINHLKEAQEIYFYHKLEIPFKRDFDYIRTRCYKVSSNTLKRDIDDSFKNVIRLCSNSFKSRFVNVFAKKNGNTILLNNNEFIELNHIIRNAISNINIYEFVDYIPFEKPMMKIEKKNAYIEKKTKIINKKYLHILRQYIEYLTL